MRRFLENTVQRDVSKNPLPRITRGYGTIPTRIPKKKKVSSGKSPFRFGPRLVFPNKEQYLFIIIIIIIWFVRLLALRPLLAYCAKLG
jgi:hypothetical protein